MSDWLALAEAGVSVLPPAPIEDLRALLMVGRLPPRAVLALLDELAWTRKESKANGGLLDLALHREQVSQTNELAALREVSRLQRKWTMDTDWIVIDPSRPGARDAEGKHLGSKVCRRCGAEEPMPAPPLPITDIPAVIEPFILAHQYCEPAR